MRNIFLSFSPQYYELLRSGRKVFEYRKRFCNEEVKAYIYLGKPIQKIVGIAWLGKRIELIDWKKQYEDKFDVLSRIKEYSLRNKYAMPIVKFQEIEAIDIHELKSVFPDFYIPLSFRNLEQGSDLLRYIENKVKEINNPIIHSFECIEEDRICEM